MRISTSEMHRSGINSILEQQRALTKQQEHIASGKRIQTAADDPIGAARAVSLRQQIIRSEQQQKNADGATSAIELQDSVFQSATNVLQRIRELMVQAQSDNLSLTDRRQVSLEISQRTQELAGLANTLDADGNYLFAGYQANTQPFILDSNGQYHYQGDDGQRFVEVTEGLRVAVTDSGNKLFNQLPAGNGTFTVSQTGAANMGTAVVNQSGVASTASFVEDTYTLTFVTNSAGELAYQVVGAASGQVVPALPATIPAQATKYVDGQTITFNGHEMRLTGTPVAGDDFSIAPSQKISIFSTVKNITDSLNLADGSAANRAEQHSQLNQSLYEIDSALETMLGARAEVGLRLNSIDSARSINDDFILQSKSALSNVEDLDFAQAISQLELKTVALQAAQQSYLRIRGLNLFNYLR